MGLTVHVQQGVCEELGARLEGVRTRAGHFMPRPVTGKASPRLVDVYLVWVGICQQTRTLEGIVDGVRYRGSDYLAHRMCAAADQDPDRFLADSLRRAGPEDLRTWLSDDGCPETSTLDRLVERSALVQDLGEGLLRGYGGRAANLLAASKGRLAGPTGLLERLAKFRAYRDPVRKKSFLLIQFLRGLGLYEPVDPEELGLPVDYHLLRVLLRAGALRLEGDRAALLLSGATMSEEEDLVVRAAAVRAGKLMTGRVDLRTLDLLLWMIGRNCCFYDHEPVCRTGPCTLSASCSLIQSTDHDCGLRCPLEGVCAGSQDAEAANRREPCIDTDLY